LVYDREIVHVFFVDWPLLYILCKRRERGWMKRVAENKNLRELGLITQAIFAITITMALYNLNISGL